MRSWKSHLGDRATPEALVGAICKKGLAGASRLRDDIKGEFNLNFKMESETVNRWR